MSAMISTRTVTINAAFLQEIKDVHHRLWETLAGLCELCDDRMEEGAAPSHHCLRQFCSLLCELRDQLALHFSLEEAYGYFDDPVDVAPHMCQRAEALRAQHQVLYLSACDLVDRVERAYDSRRTTEMSFLAECYQDFHKQLVAHEEAESELIQEAYADDLGVGD